MRLSFTEGQFVCACDFGERETVRRAGFRWNPITSRWYTNQYVVAARLREVSDESAKRELNRKLLVNKPWTGRLTYPKGLEPLPFQGDGARFALSLNRSYLAFDPGLGKTIMAAMILNAAKPEASVYISPPCLTMNVEAELLKWANFKPKIARYDHKENPSGVDILIVPDSLIHKDVVIKAISEFVRKKTAWLFVDEAHRFKSETAARTKYLFGHQRKNPSGKRITVSGITEAFERVTFLSGTPMPNRPMELYPVLSTQAPETIGFRNKFQYGIRYCAGFENEFGWDFSGASNVPELASKVLNTFMLRVKKADVLKSLPPKTEEMVLIGDNLPTRVAKMDEKLLRHFSPEDLMKSAIARSLAKEDGEESLHLATYRKELGIAKVPASIEYLKYLLSETDEAILVFAFHKNVIAELVEGLSDFKPLVITGDTPTDERLDIVKTFQTDSSRRLFIGNYLAAGVGFTLTKATRVVFTEFSWVSADNDQASDRAHRIGQRDSVYVQYLVYKNSIDRAVLETIFRKRNVIAKFERSS